MILTTVTGTYKTPSGAAASGFVTFTPRAQMVLDTTTDNLIGADPITATLDVTGSFSVQLVASEDPTLTPHGWSYQVYEGIDGLALRTYDISVPVTGPINIADQAPTPTATGATRLIPGPAGPAGPDGPTTYPGNRVVVMGASIENLHSFITSTNISFGYDWPSYAMYLSGGRFNLIRNSAIGGQTTAQFIQRFPTDVTPYAPTIVPLGSIENDIQQQVSVAQRQANIRTLVQMCRDIGAVPVLRTAMPHIDPNVHTPTGAYNAWVREYASANNIPFVDFWNVLVDNTTGFYKAEYTPDGVHPNEVGSRILAQYWLDQMSMMLPSSYQPLADASDTGQLLPTPGFSTNVAGTPTGWNAVGGTPAGTTRSMIVDPGGYGQWARLSHQGSSSAISIQSNSANITPTQASVGDILTISGMFSSDGGVPAVVSVVITTDGSSPNLTRVPVSVIQQQVSYATYKMTMPPIPSGFVRMQVTLQSGPGTGTVDFSYPVVRNITREGGTVF